MLNFTYGEREPIKVIERTYSVLFRRYFETRGYIATCRAVRGFVAYGRTLDEARARPRKRLKAASRPCATAACRYRAAMHRRRAERAHR